MRMIHLSCDVEMWIRANQVGYASLVLLNWTLLQLDGYN